MNVRLAAGMALGLASLPASLFAGPSAAADFSNATPVVVPLPGRPEGCPPDCTPNRASPYPSVIPVAGLPGPVTDVNVTLRNLTYEHNGPADADILVVAPGGKAVMVMSDACGDNDNANPITAPVTLTFDDQAGATLPADAACGSGSFRPIDDDDDGEFPFQVADAVAVGTSAPAGTSPLSTFNSIDGNGNWSLYVGDDYPNDPDPAGKSGQIGGGWTLQIATAAPAPTPAPTPAPAPTTVTTARVPPTGPTATTAGTDAVATTLVPPSSSTTLDPFTDLAGTSDSTAVATRPTSSWYEDDDVVPLAVAAALVLLGGLFATRALRARRSARLRR